MSVDSIIDHVEHGANVEDTRNNFVFHNNEEFINFQRCFVVNSKAPYEPIFSDPTDSGFQFFPSSECDHITFTFYDMGSESYKIINNRAFFLKGFRKIVIQGARSLRSNSFDIPTLEIHNEMNDNTILRAFDYNEELVDSYKTYVDDHTCHSYGTDDAIFNIQNDHDSPVDVVISDIAFRAAFSLAEVEGAALYKHWYDPTICPVFFKVYEASSFKMFNVRMYSQFLDLTHVFLHWCENVEITNCVFKNYNARKIGGNLWLCQRVKNVKIVNNDFYKYGNDENIGIWADSIMNRDELNCYNSEESLKGLDDVSFANRHLNFENIHIKNNRFYYQKPNLSEFHDNVKLGKIYEFQKSEFLKEDSEKEWDGVNDIFQNLFVSQHTPKGRFKFIDGKANNGNSGSEIGGSVSFASVSAVEDLKESAIVPYVHCLISDYVIDANEFYINSPMNVLMGMTFDNYCRTKDLKITNNLIQYGKWAHKDCQLQDFKIVYDKNPDWTKTGFGLQGCNKMCLSPVLIENNTIESVAFPHMVWGGKESEVHIVLNLENASVVFNRNTVVENVEEVKSTAESSPNVSNYSTAMGYMLLYSRDKGGRVTLNDNMFRGMNFMGSFRMQKDNSFSRIELIAQNNIFQGITTLFSENMQEGVFRFANNRFYSDNDITLLLEMPLKTFLSVTENVFKRQAETRGDVKLYYHEMSDANLWYSKQLLPNAMTIISSGNLFENNVGHICPYYADMKGFSVYSSNEFSLEDDFNEAKNE